LDNIPQFSGDRIYKLSPKDMDSIIELVSEIVDERTNEIDKLEEKLIREKSDIVDDIMDGLRPHNFWRHNFLWESCVWRLQGIFEGILDERFLSNHRRYKGLRDRLNELKKAGFEIDQELKLIEWANLRNELSHNPPKQINGHGALLGKDDIVKFREFLVDILRTLEQQKNHLNEIVSKNLP